MWLCAQYMRWSRHRRLHYGGSATPHGPSNPTDREHASTISLFRSVYHVFFVKFGFNTPHLRLLIGSGKLNGAHEGLPLRIIVEVVVIERHSKLRCGGPPATVIILICWYYVNSGDECVRCSLTWLRMEFQYLGEKVGVRASAEYTRETTHL